MSYAVAAICSAMVLVLLWALLVGEPASITDANARLNAESTEVASLRATIIARPTPTTICYTGTRHCSEVQ